MNKTKDEILNQLYISAEDLRILDPKLGTNKSLEIIKELRTEMESKKIFVPPAKPYRALTKLVRKKMGF